MKRILQISAVVALTVAFLAFFLWKSDLADVWRIMKRTDPRWLIAGLFVNAMALVFRSVRWRILVDRNHPPSFYATFFANVIGYALSATLPIRAGDVARPALLSRRSDVRFSDALGTVLTERILDLVSIVSLLLFFCVLRWRQFNDAVVHGSAIGAGVLLLALFAFTIGVYFFPDSFRGVHTRLGMMLPIRFREPWMRFFDAFAGSLRLIETPAASRRRRTSTAR